MIAVPISIAAIALILLVGLMLWHCKRQSRAMEMEGGKGGKTGDLNLKQRWGFSPQPKLAKPRDDRRRDTLIMIV